MIASHEGKLTGLWRWKGSIDGPIPPGDPKRHKKSPDGLSERVIYPEIWT